MGHCGTMSGSERDNNVFSRATFALPNVLSPSGYRCVQVNIPDDNDYLAAFMGAIQMLAKWVSWERDDNQSGKIVAQRWKDAMLQSDFLATCEGQPIYIDTGDDDMGNICTQLRIHNGKLQGLCCFNPETCQMEWADICGQENGWSPDGTITPDSGSRPAPGESHCWNKTLDAGRSWIIPFGVQNGDIISVSNRQGAWSSNGVQWTCTDGTPFALGLCSGSRYHSDDDPDATLYHGQLSLLINGQYYSLTDGDIVLSGITGQAQAVVLGNFTPQGFPGGTISFNLCVENGSTPPVGTWCYFLDFTASDFDWLIDQGSYVPGAGFVATFAGSNKAIGISAPSDILTGFNYTFVEWVFNYTGGTFSPTGAAWISNVNGVESPVVNQAGTTNGNGQVLTTEDIDIDDPANVSAYIRCAHNATDGSATITGVTLKGNGTSPFGSSNC